MALEKAVDVTVTGQVVNVGLRQWTRLLAGQLGISGWIRNNSDRSVSIHLEGSADGVEALVDRLRRPNLKLVRVDDLQMQDSELHGYSDFEVQYL